jgi:spermidine/putrescine transport system permease protein
VSPAVRPATAVPVKRRSLRLGDLVVPVFAGVAFLYLLVPIAYTVAYSFNDSFKSNLIWQGFTWQAWRNVGAAIPAWLGGDLANVPEVWLAFVTSLKVGVVATLGATVLGTLLALALVRFRFRGRALINLMIFLPMSTPEVVLGSALAAQFLSLRIEFGYWTIVAAHVLFCLSFVVVTVKARVASLDPALEAAAADLYASPLVAFWKVTFPLLLPGIAAAALLSFSLSFDDYIVTNFNSGTVKTFPVYIMVSSKRGIPPEANVLASVMFVGALLIVLVAQLLAAARAKRRA